MGKCWDGFRHTMINLAQKSKKSALLSKKTLKKMLMCDSITYGIFFSQEDVLLTQWILYPVCMAYKSIHALIGFEIVAENNGKVGK